MAERQQAEAPPLRCSPLAHPIAQARRGTPGRVQAPRQAVNRDRARAPDHQGGFNNENPVPPENPLLIRPILAFNHFIDRLTPTTADITLGFPPFVRIVLHYSSTPRRKR